MEPDYYKVLGIKENATEEEIKKAYRSIAKKYHPDANQGNHAAAERFKAASEAYAVIGDLAGRKEYDSRRAAGRAQKAGGQHSAGKGPSGGNNKPQGSFMGTGFGKGSMDAGFEQFFGFNPHTKEVHEDKLNLNKKAKTDPIDMTEMFEKYMGIKR